MGKPSKQHPESLEKVRGIKIDEDIKSFVNELAREVEEDVSDRLPWERAVDRLDKLRYGIRSKKFHPWPGCANYSIPLIDTDITKIKPAYVGLARVTPIVIYEPVGPEDVEGARIKEKLFDWRMRHKVNFFREYSYGIDQVLGAPGMTVFRIIWKFSTRSYLEVLDLSDLDEQVLGALYDPRVDDVVLGKIIEEELGIDVTFDENVKAIDKAVKEFREGKSKFELNLLEVSADTVEVTACHPKDDITVPKGTKHINDARRIDYKFWVPKNDIKIAIRDGKYENYDDSDIDSWCKSGEQEGYDDDMVLLHETCCWKDINNDGIEERCITTWPDTSPESVLRFIELPYDHGRWPYVQVKRELTENSFYATRGIPYLDEDFQVGISTAVNQAIDNGTLLNAPERVARKNVLSNPQNRRYIPGELTEINGSPSDYETRVLTNPSQPILFQQAQFLKSFANDRLGNQTAGLSSSTELPGQGVGGKKTAREIEAQMAFIDEAQSLDLLVFQDQMREVYEQIDALFDQYGPDEEEIVISGAPMKVTRYEIQGKMHMIPNGRLDNSNPNLRLKKTMMAYQVGNQNPYIKQDKLVEMVFRDIDENMSKMLLKTPEELQQEQQQQMQMMDAAQNAQMHKQVLAKKVTDDLDIRKSILLSPIEGAKYKEG